MYELRQVVMFKSEDGTYEIAQFNGQGLMPSSGVSNANRSDLVKVLAKLSKDGWEVKSQSGSLLGEAYTLQKRRGRR